MARRPFVEDDDIGDGDYREGRRAGEQERERRPDERLAGVRRRRALSIVGPAVDSTPMAAMVPIITPRPPLIRMFGTITARRSPERSASATTAAPPRVRVTVHTYSDRQTPPASEAPITSMATHPCVKSDSLSGRTRQTTPTTSPTMRRRSQDAVGMMPGVKGERTRATAQSAARSARVLTTRSLSDGSLDCRQRNLRGTCLETGCASDGRGEATAFSASEARDRRCRRCCPAPWPRP